MAGSLRVPGRRAFSAVGERGLQSGSSGFVFDIKKYAIHDGPGIRTTVFLKGCPLTCRWCHNPESWRQQPQLGVRASRCVRCGRCAKVCRSGAISLTDSGPLTNESKCRLCGECVRACTAGAREIIGRKMTAGEVMAEITKDVIFYDESGGGVTFSGGEPLMQAEFLLDLLERCRAEEIHTAIDTTCHAERAVLERVGERADLFLCDLKHIDSKKHKDFTGVENDLILDNIRHLASSGRRIVMRIPIVPGFNDDDASVEMAGQFTASLPGVDEVDILPYNRGGKAKSIRLTTEHNLMQGEVPGDEKMSAISSILGKFGLTVKIGG
jgi:pyruvate formate lyase activating enzyme